MFGLTVAGTFFSMICLYYATSQTFVLLNLHHTLFSTQQHDGRLGDLKDFTFVINNDVCRNDDIFLLFSVTSDPKKKASRDVLRAAYRREINGKKLQVIFNMGTIQSPDIMRQIQEENLAHKDIIMGSFIDSYRNVSYLHLQGMKWGVTYCPSAEYIVKTDQDIFIDVYKLVSKLHKESTLIKDSLFCKLLVNTTPFRDPGNRYYISVKEYPRERYPTYCNGWVVVFPMNVATQILKTATKVPLVWISDVYVTGVVIEKMAWVRFVDMEPDYTTNSKDLLRWIYTANASLNVFAGSVDTDLALLAALHYKTDYLHKHRLMSSAFK